ncbi:hypothetical protein DPMN_163011 [Dreissena polymorpha]|uniref:Uncharacterized protein n=1 Tax=Dreissena polymorpha TaxID=45954 RepID=A0A9D4IUU1_DREPO|nr:hypothetical protein DPMN_163011 [Dreissena polymorpha]
MCVAIHEGSLIDNFLTNSITTPPFPEDEAPQQEQKRHYTIAITCKTTISASKMKSPPSSQTTEQPQP